MPICDESGEYRFQFDVGNNDTQIRIDYGDSQGRLLHTAISGRGAAYGAPALARAFVLYPWMTFGVMARIHLQALRLWIKGVPWFAKPAPPSQELTR